MNQFRGKIGFSIPVNKGHGIYDNSVVERTYRGDILSQSRKLDAGTNINDNIDMNIRLSILSDDFLNVHLSQITYVHYMGGVWKVKSIEPSRPRIVLALGGVYNGPMAASN